MPLLLPPSLPPSLPGKSNGLAASVNLDIGVVKRCLAQDKTPASHDFKSAERYVDLRHPKLLRGGKEGGREAIREGGQEGEKRERVRSRNRQTARMTLCVFFRVQMANVRETQINMPGEVGGKRRRAG